MADLSDRRRVGALVLRAARAEDALRLAAELRAADRAELAASGAGPAGAAVAAALAASPRPMALERAEDGGLVALYGVAPFPDAAEDDPLFGARPRGVRFGAPWLLATPRLTAVSRSFVRGCRAEAARLCRGYDLLANRVDARNALHIRWLVWLGFRFVRLDPAFGPEGRPFFEFVRLGAPERLDPEQGHAHV